MLILGLLNAGAFAVHPAFGWLCFAAACVMGYLVVNFFRNPPLTPLRDDTQILAPCEGQVVVIEEVEDKTYFNKPMRQVSIFMSPLNVHVNRNPISGVIRFFRYVPGKYLMAFNPKSSELNEQTYIVVSNGSAELGYKQIAGFLARRLHCYIKEGDSVLQGEEFGFISFGSRIDLLLPLECKVVAALGQKVKAGESVIATF